MKPTDPPPVRPSLCAPVYAALVKAGRPITRGELAMFLHGGYKAADYQAALDTLVAEGLAVRGEEPGRRPWKPFVVWRAVDDSEDQR